jgi:predicted Zn-dependent protease
MKPQTFAWIFVSALLLIAIYSGFHLYSYLSSDDFILISPDSERQLGDALYGELSAQENICTDSILFAGILSIIQRLDRDLSVQQNPVVLHIHNNSELNAYALPGGHIIVNAEMIRFCQSPEELAGVIAHELGHVEHRHGVNRLIQQFGLTIILAIATGTESSALQDAGMSLLNNYFSREDETQADDFAMQQLIAAQIDPVCMSTVFARMAEHNGDMNGVMNFLSTHPELSERAAGAATFPKPSDFVAIPFDINWSDIHERASKAQ